MRLVKVLCALAILIFVNRFPWQWGRASPAKVDLELYPKDPYNVFYTGTDLSVTVCMRNGLDIDQSVELHLIGLPPGAIAVGRDGIPLPSHFDVPSGENVYYSIAILALDNVKGGDVEFVLLDPENKVTVDRKKMYINRIMPQLTSEELISKAQEYGLSDGASTFCIPKYRRYWHPELDEVGYAKLGYVWLLVGQESCILIDDNGGKLLIENPVLPWEIEALEHGEAKVWQGDKFGNLQVPRVEVTGDNTFDFQRFELYYASWQGSPSWVTRQSFYWAGEGITGQEVPDTERIELWVSAENGEKLFTISDYHFHTFRYDPIDSYILLGYWHCPLPSDIDAQMWFNFVLADYENVYPSSDTPNDHIGFSPEIHPVSAAFREYKPIVNRNLLSFGITGILFLSPKIYRISGVKKRKRVRSKARSS